MLKTRAITVTFRFYFGLALAGVVGALTAAIGSNSADPIISRVIGPLSVGWKGGVGDHFAYAVLLGLAVAAAFLAGLFTAFRDADPSAEAQIAQLDTVPLTQAPIGANYWPVISVFALGLLLVGLAVSNRSLALAGAVVLGAAAFMWTTRAWAERATADGSTNIELYHQVVEPLRLPIVAVLLVGAMAIGFSRVLLALPNKNSSAAVFGLMAALMFAGAAFVAFRQRLNRSAVIIALVVLGVVIIGVAIVVGIHGSRDLKPEPPAGQEQPVGQGG
jgi:hypothetical protein